MESHDPQALGADPKLEAGLAAKSLEIAELAGMRALRDEERG